MSEMPASPYVSRINQIDAGILDEEIYKILRNQVKIITQHLPPGRTDKYQPEIDAFLKFLIWYYSLKRKGATFGQQLLNLNYPRIDKKKSILYLVLTTVPKYFQEKFVSDRKVFSDNRTNTIKLYIEWFVNIVNLLEFINLIIFLHRGTQPFLVEKLLGISSQSVTTHRPRNIGYSYMTRELLWHGLMELFAIGIPMINFHYLKQLMKRLWARRKDQKIKKTYPIMTSSTKCVYCNDTPILPVHAGCEHIFCYYCLKAHFTAMQMFHCPACDIELYAHNMRNYIAPSTTVIEDEKT